jgi:hypothetical protein
MPSWLQFLGFWENVSIFAYSLAFALLESVVLLSILIILSAVLPVQCFRDKFVAQSSIMVFVATFWAIVFQSVDAEIHLWSLAEGLFWGVLCLTAIGVSCVLVDRSKRLEGALSAFAERLTVFLYIYVPMSMLGLVVVISRNILGSG